MSRCSQGGGYTNSTPYTNSIKDGSLDRVLSKMGRASLRSYKWGSYHTCFTVAGLRGFGLRAATHTRDAVLADQLRDANRRRHAGGHNCDARRHARLRGCQPQGAQGATCSCWRSTLACPCGTGARRHTRGRNCSLRLAAKEEARAGRPRVGLFCGGPTPPRPLPPQYMAWARPRSSLGEGAAKRRCVKAREWRQPPYSHTF